MNEEIDSLLNKVALKNDEIEYIFKIAVNMFNNNKFESAKLLLNRCLENNLIKSIYYLRKIYEKSKDYDNIINMYRKAIKLKDENSMFELGKIYIENDIVARDLNLAIIIWNKINDIEIIKKIIEIGYDYFDDKKYDICEEIFVNVLTKGYETEFIYNILIIIYSLTEEYSKYNKIISEGIKKKSFVCLKESIKFYFKNNEYDKCLKLCFYCYKIGYSYGYYKIGCINIKLKKYKEAIKFLNIAIDNKYYDALIKIAEMHYYGYYFEKNEEKSKQVLIDAINKGNVKAIREIVKIYTVENDIEKIKKYFEIGKQLGDIESLYSLGHIYKFEGNIDNFILYLGVCAQMNYFNSRKILKEYEVNKDIYSEKIKLFNHLRKKNKFF